MSFSEKLTELRKKEGLSQEELGYRLNVTRQTVSKWELGQTTPEMDKILELSKIFNVSTDELIGSVETEYNSNPVKEEKTVDKDKKKRIIIIAVVAVVVVALFLGASHLQKINLVGDIFGTFNQQKDVADDIVNSALGIIDTVQNQMNEQLNDSDETNETKNDILDLYESATQEIEDGKNKIEEEIDEFEVNKFNSQLELYQGTKYGNSVRVLFDKIITNNKTEERKVTLKFTGKELTDGNQIKDLKSKIDNFTQYEVSFEYDADGYIYETLVERIK